MVYDERNLAPPFGALVLLRGCCSGCSSGVGWTGCCLKCCFAVQRSVARAVVVPKGKVRARRTIDRKASPFESKDAIWDVFFKSTHFLSQPFTWFHYVSLRDQAAAAGRPKELDLHSRASRANFLRVFGQHILAFNDS